MEEVVVWIGRVQEERPLLQNLSRNIVPTSQEQINILKNNSVT